MAMFVLSATQVPLIFFIDRCIFWRISLFVCWSPTSSRRTEIIHSDNVLFLLNCNNKESNDTVITNVHVHIHSLKCQRFRNSVINALGK